MPKYIVFDVETPNRYNNRMSAIGISIVENGKIVKSFFSYVDPEQSFDWFNTKLTGIDARTVAGAPTFPELWKKIEPILSSGVLVAHNASFDMGVLKKCLKDYNIQWKSAVPYSIYSFTKSEITVPFSIYRSKIFAAAVLSLSALW